MSINDVDPGVRKLIRMRRLLELVPLSKRWIDQLEAAGRFPRRIALSENSVAWYEHEIAAWLDERRATGQTAPLGARSPHPSPTSKRRGRPSSKGGRA